MGRAGDGRAVNCPLFGTELSSRQHANQGRDILRRRDQIIALASQYGASNVRLFGSLARGNVTPDYDIDLLVKFEPGRSLLDQGGLLMDLRELLGAEVDVVSEGP